MPNYLTSKAFKKKILSAIDHLPTMPRIMIKAREIIEDPNANLKNFADLIEVEPAIALRILKLANSAYYRPRKGIASVQDAVIVLGLNILYELITIACSSILLGKSLNGYGVTSQDFWKHSLAVAFGAKLIAQKEFKELADEAFTAGLIHDCGKLVLDRYILERKEMFDVLTGDNRYTAAEAERELFGFDHADIATSICAKWQFPKRITAAIRNHHNTPHFCDNELALIIHTADQIANWAGLDIDEIYIDVEPRYLDKLGLDIHKIDALMNEMSESINQIASSYPSNTH